MQFKERAARNDAHRVAYLLNQSIFRGLEAKCFAAAGKCDEGVKVHVDAARLSTEIGVATGYRMAPKPDAELEKQAKEDLRQWCPKFK